MKRAWIHIHEQWIIHKTSQVDQPKSMISTQPKMTCTKYLGITQYIWALTQFLWAQKRHIAQEKLIFGENRQKIHHLLFITQKKKEVSEKQSHTIFKLTSLMALSH